MNKTPTIMEQSELILVDQKKLAVLRGSIILMDKALKAGTLDLTPKQTEEAEKALRQINALLLRCEGLYREAAKEHILGPPEWCYDVQDF